MKRRGLLAGLTAGILSPISSAFAAPIPPTKCFRVGQTTVFAGKKFTCVRVKVKGNYKLVWNKGISVPVKQTATPTPSNSPTPSRTATPSTSATPTPSTSATPTQSPMEPKKLGTILADSSAVDVGETKFFVAKNLSGITVTYIVFRSKSGITVMSDICTHLGCAVQLKNGGLLCPCHNSLFNATSGAVERGPASRSLQRFEAFEENGKIKVVD